MITIKSVPQPPLFELTVRNVVFRKNGYNWEKKDEHSWILVTGWAPFLLNALLEIKMKDLNSTDEKVNTHLLTTFCSDCGVGVSTTHGAEIVKDNQ